MNGHAFFGRRRKAMKRNIPEEYQQVAWVGPKQVSAVCYVDTGFTPNQDTRVVSKFVRVTESINSAYYGSEEPRFTLLKNRADYNAKKTFSLPIVALNKPVVADHNRNYVTINGTKYGPIDPYAEFTCAKSLYLWSLNGYAQTQVQFCGRMYYCRIYDNDVLVRDFVPCYRKADGVIGLYCKATRTFYEPSGEVSLVTKGEDVQ